MSFNKTQRSWTDLRNIAECGLKLTSLMNSNTLTNFSFAEKDNHDWRIYYLGSGIQKREVTIKYIDIDLMDTSSSKIIKYGKTLFQQTIDNSNEDSSRELTKEEQLLRERKRCSFNGITSYCVDKFRLVFSEHSDLFYYDQDKTDVIQIYTASKGAIDVQLCPLDINLLSYVLGDNLYIYKLDTGIETQLTHTNDPIKSGTPSYCVQEEFNRYTGYWWRPIITDDFIYIMYEEVDDSDVDLVYITPSCTNDQSYDQYRYPRVGTNNSKVTLKLLKIHLVDGQVKDFTQYQMKRSFYQLFSWFEYLSRAGWTPDGQL